MKKNWVVLWIVLAALNGFVFGFNLGKPYPVTMQDFQDCKVAVENQDLDDNEEYYSAVFVNSYKLMTDAKTPKQKKEAVHEIFRSYIITDESN